MAHPALGLKRTSFSSPQKEEAQSRKGKKISLAEITCESQVKGRALKNNDKGESTTKRKRSRERRKKKKLGTTGGHDS